MFSEINAVCGAMISRPPGVVSLNDLMQKFNLDQFSSSYRALCSVCEGLIVHDIIETPEQEASYCVSISVLLKAVAEHCRFMEIDTTLILQVERLADSLADGSADRRTPVLKAQLTAIIDGLQASLSSRLFYLIPQGRAVFINDFEWFERLSLKFPDALHEIFEMRFCYVLGRNTASVFHGMRAAEHGLRHIARALKVKIMDKRKPCPIEYGTWDKVINAIQSKINKLHQSPKGKMRESHLRFYADCASQCAYMRDIWRNDTAHARRRYNEPEALAAGVRVLDFLYLLANGPEGVVKKIEAPKKPGPLVSAIAALGRIGSYDGK